VSGLDNGFLTPARQGPHTGRERPVSFSLLVIDQKSVAREPTRRVISDPTASFADRHRYAGISKRCRKRVVTSSLIGALQKPIDRNGRALGKAGDVVRRGADLVEDGIHAVRTRVLRTILEFQQICRLGL